MNGVFTRGESNGKGGKENEAKEERQGGGKKREGKERNGLEF